MTAWWAASSISTVSTTQSSETSAESRLFETPTSRPFLAFGDRGSWSLRAGLLSGALFAHLSPAAKIPFPVAS